VNVSPEAVIIGGQVCLAQDLILQRLQALAAQRVITATTAPFR